MPDTNPAPDAARDVERTEIEALRAEVERLRGEAEGAAHTRNEFLATMSHELHTPLNAIGGHAQLLALGLHGAVTEAQRGALERILRAQRHLLSVVDDVLSFARVEGGRVSYDVRATRLDDVLADVATLAQPEMVVHGLHFDVRVPAVDPPCEVWADATLLRQVLLNVLANAIKFTPAGGRVTLESATRAAGEGGHPELVFVRVSDTGVGIPADRLATVFEPFVQGERGLTREHEGTGLGLAISRDLAHGMGGELRVRSLPGVGSTFTLALRRVVTSDGEETDRRYIDERRADERRADDRRAGDDRRADGDESTGTEPARHPSTA
jgi:signal transduction histidine kinase